MPWMSLEELLLVQTGSDSYNQRQRRAIFYAQSWLLVHYLMSKQKLPRPVQLFAIDANQTDYLLRRRLSRRSACPPDEFEKSLRDYFQGQALSDIQKDATARCWTIPVFLLIRSISRPQNAAGCGSARALARLSASKQ